MTSFCGAESTPLKGPNRLLVPGRSGPQDISEVIPGVLFHSGLPAARGVKALGIDAVFNVSFEPAMPATSFSGIQVMAPLYDSMMSNIDTAHVHDIALMAIEMIRAGRSVLVHCQMGFNRSSLLLGVILMGLGFRDNIVDHLCRSRGQLEVLSNPHFRDYLDELQATGSDRRAAAMARSQEVRQ